jgi:glucose/arabinose dehydrogenase
MLSYPRSTRVLIAVTTLAASIAAVGSATVVHAACTTQLLSWAGFASLHSSQSTFTTSISVPPPTSGEVLTVLQVSYTNFDGQSAGASPSRAVVDEPFEQFGIRIGATDVASLTTDLPDTIAEGAASDNYSGLVSGNLAGWAGASIQGGAVTLRHSSLYGLNGTSSNSLTAYALSVTTERCSGALPTTVANTVAPSTTGQATTTTSAPTTTTAPHGVSNCTTESYSWSGFAALHSAQPIYTTTISIPAVAVNESLTVMSVAYTAFEGQSAGAVPSRAAENEPYEEFGIRIGTTDVTSLSADLPDTVAEGAANDNYSGLNAGSLDGWVGVPIQGGTATLRHASLYGFSNGTSNSLVAYSLSIAVSRCRNTSSATTTTTTYPVTTTTNPATTTTGVNTTTTAPVSSTTLNGGSETCSTESFPWTGFVALHSLQTSYATGLVIPAPAVGETLRVVTVSYTTFEGKSAGAVPSRATEDEPYEQLGIRIGTTDITSLSTDLPDTVAEGATNENYSGLNSGSLAGWIDRQIQGGGVTLRHASLYGLTSTSSNSLTAYALTVTTRRCTASNAGTTTTNQPSTTIATASTTTSSTSTTVGGAGAGCTTRSYPWTGFVSLHTSQALYATELAIQPPGNGETLRVLGVSYTTFDGKSAGSVPSRAAENEPFEQFGLRIGQTDVAALSLDLPDTVAEGAADNNYSGLVNGNLHGWVGTAIQGGAVYLRHASQFGYVGGGTNSLIVYALTINTELCSASNPTSTSTSATTSTTTSTTSLPPTLGANSVAFTQIGALDQGADVANRYGDSHIYVLALNGTILRVDPGTGQSINALVLPPGVIGPGYEQGLLGVAFSIDGSMAYIDFVNVDGDIVINEYAVLPDGTFDVASKRLVIMIDHPDAHHYGGAIRVGPDGYLYISTGDGDIGGDPGRRSLDLSDLLGKILRIDPTATPAGDAYSIPPDNPFLSTVGAQPEIWSIGLRNPWRFSFDRVTGDMWIGDVGQDGWEEIDFAAATQGGGSGENYGWSALEGNHVFNVDQSAVGATMPIYEYSHDADDCSITAGVRYRGTAIPQLYGFYVFGDFCSGRIHALQINADGSVGQDITFTNTIPYVTSLGEDGNGEIYATDLASGAIWKLIPA